MNHSEETQSASEVTDRGGTPGRRLPVRLLLSTLFLLSSFPLGILWSAVLVVLLLIGLPLTIVWAGLPVIALAAPVCVLATGFERRRLGALLGARLPSPYRSLPRGSVVARARARAKDPALWRGLLYLLLLLPIGLVELIVVFFLAFSAVLATYPLWFWALPDGVYLVMSNAFVADTVPEALLVTLVGLVLASAASAFAVQASQAHASLGQRLLGKRETLDERVEALTQSRSKAVQAAIVERRRIERDLHDGAQQRLVSLAMVLGMARQKLENGSGAADGDSEATGATELVKEAHEEAKRALAEIRDLIRGIHPAVLTDRGLDAAISALAGHSSVPTSVEVELDERPPEAAEITAYFMIAEAMTNAARHSGASEALVSVRRERGTLNGGFPEDLLVVEVEDDGMGGADPTGGTGLQGLADRALVLDGRLTVESPAGGPTRVRAELPWGMQNGG